MRIIWFAWTGGFTPAPQRNETRVRELRKKGYFMKTTGSIEYRQYYLPNPESRREHVRTVTKEVPIEIPEAESKDLPVVFRVKGRVYRDDYPYGTEYFADNYYLYQGKLYRPDRINDGGDETGNVRTLSQFSLQSGTRYREYSVPDASKADEWDPERSVVRNHPGGPDSEETITKAVLELADGYLLIDGVLCERAGEPYYLISRPGFGENMYRVCIDEYPYDSIDEYPYDSVLPRLLDKDLEFNALETSVMNARYPHLYPTECRIAVTPGFENYVRLRRDLKKDGYVWSDAWQRYERKWWSCVIPGERYGTWEISFRRDFNTYCEEITAHNEDNALAEFFRDNPYVCYHDIKVSEIVSPSRPLNDRAW